MTLLLERAFEQVAQLSASQQDEIAAWILAELEAEARWEHLFASSQDLLAEMAADALREHRAGNEIVWFWVGPHDQYERLLKHL